jgi:triacylglycerol esterase/lipase EstA (alpha/beta hydrolase family)
MADESQSRNHRGARECVILLHGLGRTKRSMRRLANALENAGYEVQNQGYPSMRTSVAMIAQDHLAPVVAECRQRDAGKVHFVTHSLGGIVVRQYLQQHEAPAGSRMVMLSPPNQGSELAEALRHLALYRWIMGPAGQELGKFMRTARGYRDAAVERCNRRVAPPQGDCLAGRAMERFRLTVRSLPK